MSKMPTTRRGRYLFYRARAKRRHKRIYACLSRPDPDAHAQAARSYDTSGLEMQFVKVGGPKYVQSPRPFHFWLLTGRVKPDYKLWGVVPSLVPHSPFWSPKTSFRSPVTFYAFRRVHHVPRLKHLPIRPYRFPIAAVDKFSFYPWKFYPSGQYNPRWWRED